MNEPEASELPDPSALVLALATMPEPQRVYLARLFMVSGDQAMKDGKKHLGRAWLELAKICAHATELADPVSVTVDRLMAAALTPPVMISPN